MAAEFPGPLVSMNPIVRLLRGLAFDEAGNIS